MRQTTHLYMATVATALAMSCALPYATRASLNPQELIGVAAPRMSSEMPAAAPMEFIAFPRSTMNWEAEQQSLDLSMTTPQGFLALSNNLNKETGWTSATLPIITSRPTERTVTPYRKGHEASRTLPNRIEQQVDRIAFNKPVLAPVAFVRFCMRYEDDCKATPAGLDRAPVPLTSTRLAELEKINEAVNRAIKPEANLGGVVAEEWLVSPRRGDCNDYAVTKRHELLVRGWPAHSLLLAEVVIASGEHHLVLVVRTSEQDFVLDNLNTVVRPVSQIEYEWVRAQQLENPRFWAAISVARADRVAMNSR